MIERFTESLLRTAMAAALKTGERQELLVYPMVGEEDEPYKAPAELLTEVWQAGLVITHVDEPADGGRWRTYSLDFDPSKPGPK